jgi:hypothetical protein
MRVGRYIAMGSTGFPPQAVREILREVTTLLRDRGETVSVAETVRITIFIWITRLRLET